MDVGTKTTAAVEVSQRSGGGADAASSPESAHAGNGTDGLLALAVSVLQLLRQFQSQHCCIFSRKEGFDSLHEER
jgi:hypothetical protein